MATKPSEISHILFRREDGWTVPEARRWLEEHDFSAPKKYDEMTSEGGEKLIPGTYIYFRIASRTKKFTSYGYSDEISRGVWFKFGGYRKRSKAREKTKGDWAWLGDERVFIPDVKIEHDDPTYVLHPVRGYSGSLIVEDIDGQIIGWMPIEVTGYSCVRDWIKGVNYIERTYNFVV